MMLARVDGTRVTKTRTNLGTSAVDLITAAQKKSVTLESISFCNRSAGDLNYSFYIKHSDGTTLYYINYQRPVSSKYTLYEHQHAVTLLPGQSFTVVASGTGIDVVGVFIESTVQDHSSTPKSLGDF